jgi:hypothetical protein
VHRGKGRGGGVEHERRVEQPHEPVRRRLQFNATHASSGADDGVVAANKWLHVLDVHEHGAVNVLAAQQVQQVANRANARAADAHHHVRVPARQLQLGVELNAQVFCMGSVFIRELVDAVGVAHVRQPLGWIRHVGRASHWLYEVWCAWCVVGALMREEKESLSAIALCFVACVCVAAARRC